MEKIPSLNSKLKIILKLIEHKSIVFSEYPDLS